VSGVRERSGLPLAFVPLMLSYLAVAITITVTTVALPTISIDLQVSAASLIWIVNVTPVAAAALIFFGGSWSDRFGRRRVLLIGLTIFLVSATLSAFASTPEQLIAMRALTGVGTALIMPPALALTFDVVPERSQRTAVGIIGATQAVGALLGPIIAGALLLVFPWGSVFLSVTPLLLVAIVLVAWKVPSDTQSDENAAPLDVPGALLMGVLGLSFLYAAVTAAARNSSSDLQVAAAVVIGVVALIALVLWEIRCPNPIFVGSILRARNFWVPTAVIFAVQFALGGVMFLNTQYVQLVLGFSAFGAGLFLVPALATWIASSVTAGLWARRIGVRPAVATSLAVSALGMALLATGGISPQFAIFVAALLLVGCMGLAPALTTHMAVSAYPEQRRTVGSAINSVAIRFGLAFGVATLGSVLGITYSRGLAPAIVDLSSADRTLADNSLGGALQVAARLGGSAEQVVTDAARAAFASGFSHAMVVTAVILAALAVVAAIWLPNRTPTSEVVQDAGTG
jgi:DHA2 family multidrug resistance protein-like MFS transporter